MCSQPFIAVARSCTTRARTRATAAALVKRFATAATLAMALACSDADAELIATYRLDGGAGLLGPSIPPVTGASVGTGFMQQGSSALVGCLGCFSFLPLGTVQNLDTDFTPANSPEFDTFVAHLNNGVDDYLFFFITLFVGSGMRWGPISGAGLESDLFGSTFAGASRPVDLIRRHLDFFSFQQDANSVQLTVRGQWEIYGPIPEPSIAGLLLAGLTALGARRLAARSHRRLGTDTATSPMTHSDPAG